MDLEEYLIGVTAAEMPASYEYEALCAQAIAARTYTVRKMDAYGGSGCDGSDICTSSAHCQAYASKDQRKKNWGNNFDKYEAKITKAVMETSGKIITYENQPIDAVFHSTAGGMTEDSENAFSSKLPYLRSVKSVEEDAPKYQSQVSMKISYMANKLNDFFKEKVLTTKNLPKKLKVAKRFESGRIDKLVIGTRSISGKEFRKLFSLDSTNFTFKFSGDKVNISSKGFGHGVGMSQTGANKMAKEGADFEEILTYYYTGVTIEYMD